jgi:uncharacterized membrane protein YoaK (UPF0700 family)
VKNSLYTVAALLGFVGGFVDAAGYLGLGGLFTSYVTGNLAVLGARLARQQMHGGGGAAGVAFIPIFAGAVAIAGIIARASRGSRFGDAAALLFVEGGILSLTALSGHLSSDALARLDTIAITSIGSMAVVAMGLQNGMMRESFGGHAPTTVMTGNVTQLSLDLLTLARTSRRDTENRTAVLGRIRKYGAALAGFVVGAAAGAALEHFLGMVAVAVPAAVLLALGIVTLHHRLSKGTVAPG